MKQNKFSGWIQIIVLLVFSSLIFAQEHPEHPTQHEHPTSTQAGITKEALADAIEGYVKNESQLKGGYFLFYDSQEDKSLVLTLDRVHEERLSRISDNVYFACADFKSKDGTMYDLDIFMKGSSADDLEVTEISLHKKAGKPRYQWVEKNGLWEKQKTN